MYYVVTICPKYELSIAINSIQRMHHYSINGKGGGALLGTFTLGECTATAYMVRVEALS